MFEQVTDIMLRIMKIVCNTQFLFSSALNLLTPSIPYIDCYGQPFLKRDIGVGWIIVVYLLLSDTPLLMCSNLTSPLRGAAPFLFMSSD